MTLNPKPAKKLVILTRNPGLPANNFKRWSFDDSMFDHFAT